MDIELMSKMIGELVLDHSEVGLPGLGTFVVEDVPASFTDRGYTINPPYRSLSFRTGDPEDSAMVSYYAECNHLTEDSSRAILKDYLTQLKSLLDVRRAVSLPGLGRLKVTAEGVVFFIPDENLTIYPDGLPLEPISLKNHVDTSDTVEFSAAHLSQILASGQKPVQAATEPAASTAEPSAPADPGLQAPAAEPEAPISDEPEIPSEDNRRSRKPFSCRHPVLRNVLIYTVVAAVVAFSAFLVLVEVAPGFIDSILYTPEELEIINWQ